jgi:antitoxin ParD1/3/4
MNIRLTPELEKLVAQEVASGHYASASEVVREGLRLLVEERRWRSEIRGKIADGVAEAKAGKLLHGERGFTKLRRRVRDSRTDAK